MKKHLSIWAGVVGVAWLLGGCGGQQAENSAQNAGKHTATAGGDKLTIGYTPTIVLPQPLLGLDGAYAKEMPGVATEGKIFKAGSGVIEALRSGSIDIGSSGPFPALTAFAKVGDIVLLSGAATGGTELMVAKNGPIKSVKDLKGKIVGVNQVGSTVDAMVRYNIIQAGLAPDTDVKIIAIDPAEQASALQGGELAAVAAPAPWPSVVQEKANGRPLLDWKQILDNGDYAAGSFYTTKKFADAHPDLIKKFLTANKKITDQLNADRAKGDPQVLAAWEKVAGKKLDPKIAKDAFATIKFTLDPGAKGLERFADIALKTGVLRKKADLKGFIYEAP